MKNIASARFLVMVVVLSTLLQVLATILFSGSILIGISFVLLIATMGVLSLWLAVRSARSNRLLQSKVEKIIPTSDATISEILASLTELSRLIDLNTESIRELYQRSNVQRPHPRDLQAIDNIQEMNQKLDAIQETIANLIQTKDISK